MQFEGDMFPLSGLLHSGVQRVCVAQVGLVALGARRVVWAPSWGVASVAAELSLSCGHVRVVRASL